MSGCGGGNASPLAPPSKIPLYVADTGTNDVTVMNAVDGKILTKIPTGNGPVRMAQDGRFVYVVNSGSDSVSVIDSTSNVVVASIPVGRTPKAITLDSSRNLAYVANSADSTLSVITLSSRTVTATLPVGKTPIGLASDVANEIAVANQGDGTLQFIDTQTNAIEQTLPLGGAPALLISDGTQFYAALAGSKTILEVSNGGNGNASRTPYHLTNTYTVPAPASALCSCGFLYVAQSSGNVISAIDPLTFSLQATYDVQAPVAMTDGGKNVYVAGSDDAVSVLDTSTGKITATYPLTQGSNPSDLTFLVSYATPAPGPTTTASSSPTPILSPTPSPTPAASPTPTPVPAVAQNLYVADTSGVSGGRILKYALPLSLNSQPSAAVPVTNLEAVAVDAAGDVAANDLNANVMYFYKAPLTSASVPVASWPASAHIYALAFDASGNLYGTTYGTAVLVFKPPFSNATTVAQTIGGFTNSEGVVFDPSGNLYVSNAPSGVSQPQVVDELAPPYGAVTKTFQTAGDGQYFNPLAYTGNTLLADDGSAITAFTSSRTFQFGTAGFSLASDAFGNLYVSNGTNTPPAIAVYPPPFGPSSSSVFTLGISNGLALPGDIAAGK